MGVPQASDQPAVGMVEGRHRQHLAGELGHGPEPDLHNRYVRLLTNFVQALQLVPRHVPDRPREQYGRDRGWLGMLVVALVVVAQRQFVIARLVKDRGNDSPWIIIDLVLVFVAVGGGGSRSEQFPKRPVQQFVACHIGVVRAAVATGLAG